MDALDLRLQPEPRVVVDQARGLVEEQESKSADIEQALIIGARGPRSCTVFVVG